MQAIFYKVTYGYSDTYGTSLIGTLGFLGRSYRLGEPTYGFKGTPVYVFDDFGTALRYKYAAMGGWMGDVQLWVCLCMPWRGRGDYTMTQDHERWGLLNPTTENVSHWWNTKRIWATYRIDRLLRLPDHTRAVEWCLPLALVYDQNEWMYRR